MRIIVAQEGVPEELPGEAGETLLDVGSFRSMRALEDALIRMGPKIETYERMYDLIGHKEEDEVKPALASFFGGSPTALCFLYKLLVEAGKANAIDEDIVAEVTQMHPELTPDDPEGEKKAAGLFLPPVAKTASGYTGGPNSGEKYTMHGPEQTRMCPKIRDVVSTHICRYHCLDGLTIDDAETVCAEAIWRESIMDKFSRDFRDKDGKRVGGYLRGRFLIEENTEGNDYQLRPGQRGRPIKEQAFSTEKRLAEMRKEHGEERGYAGVHEPDDLYNFDQHALHTGPESAELDAKERDPIAKNAGANGEVKVADSMFKQQDILGPEEPVEEDLAPEGSEPTDAPLFPEPPPVEPAAEPVAESPPPAKDAVYTTDKNNWYRRDAPGVALYDREGNLLVGEVNARAHFGPDVDLWDFSDVDNPKVIPSGVSMPPVAASGKSFNLRRARNPSAQKSAGKNSFNLRRKKIADSLLGEGEEAAAATAGKRCTNCEAIAKSDDEVCPACYGKLEDVTKMGFQNASGAIPKPKALAGKDPEITLANGIYRARLGKIAAFGDTAEESVKNLAEMTMPTVGELSRATHQTMEGDGGPPLPPRGEPESPAVPPQAPVEPPQAPVAPESAHIDAADLDAIAAAGAVGQNTGQGIEGAEGEEETESLTEEEAESIPGLGVDESIEPVPVI